MAAGDTYQYGTVDDDPVIEITVPAGTGRVKVINMSGATKIGFTTNGATPSLTGNNPVLPATPGVSVNKDMENYGTAVKLIGGAAGTEFGVWAI